MRAFRKTYEDQRGAVIVEFAVCFLLLMFLLFGVIEFGFLWMQSHYINNAAREGARAAAKLAVDVDPVPVVEDAVKNMLSGVYDDAMVEDCCGTGDFIAVTVNETTIDIDGDTDLNAVEVVVNVQTSEVWEPVLWGLLNLLPGIDMDDIDSIDASAIFVREDQSSP